MGFLANDEQLTEYTAAGEQTRFMNVDESNKQWQHVGHSLACRMELYAETLTTAMASRTSSTSS